MTQAQNTQAANVFAALATQATAPKQTEAERKAAEAAQFAVTHAVNALMRNHFGVGSSVQNVSFVGCTRMAQIAREKGAGCTLAQALPEIKRPHMRAGLEAGYVALCEAVGIAGASLNDTLAVVAENMGKVCKAAQGEWVAAGAEVVARSGLKVTQPGARLALALVAKAEASAAEVETPEVVAAEAKPKRTGGKRKAKAEQASA